MRAMAIVVSVLLAAAAVAISPAEERLAQMKAWAAADPEFAKIATEWLASSSSHRELHDNKPKKEKKQKTTKHIDRWFKKAKRLKRKKVDLKHDLAECRASLNNAPAAGLHQRSRRRRRRREHLAAGR